MRLYFFMGGICFGVLQFCYFLLLEWQLSSAWTSYMAVTLAWMAGIQAGLRWVPRKAWVEHSLVFFNAPCYYGLWFALERWPFDQRFLLLYALLVLGSGYYAGYFFRSSFARWGQVRWLFLYENNGFVGGLLLSFLGFVADGRLFLTLAPVFCLLLLAFFQRMSFEV